MVDSVQRVKNIAIVVLIVIQVCTLIFFLTQFTTILSKLEDILDWVESNPTLSLSMLFTAETICVAGLTPVPILNSLLIYSCIYLYKVFPGTLVGLLLGYGSLTIGCTLNFLLAKYLLGNQARNNINKKHSKIKALCKAIENSETKFIILIRLVPIPLPVVNYGLALTKISWGKFLCGNLGFLPKTLVAVYILATVESFRDGFSGFHTLNIVLIALGLIAAIVVVVFLIIWAKRELAKINTDENYVEMSEAPN